MDSIVPERRIAADRRKGPRRKSDRTRATPFQVWVLLTSFAYMTISLIFLLRPDLVQTSAYSYAFEHMPVWAWGIYAGVTSAIGVTSLVLRKAVLGYVHLGMLLLCQFMFGLSIFLLTLDGRYSAIVGTLQWWLVGVASAVFLWAASMGRVRPWS